MNSLEATLVLLLGLQLLSPTTMEIMGILQHSSLSSRIACRRCGLMADSSHHRTAQSMFPFATNRIINGKPVNPPQKYPWIVSLIVHGTKIFCGGALISTRFVLTAGHCVIKLSSMSSANCLVDTVPQNCYATSNDMKVGLVGPGSSSVPMKEIDIERIIPHPRFSNKGLANDIALIKLAEPAPCGKNLRPICLPRNDLNKMNQHLIIAGWGKNSPSGTKGEKLLREGKVKQVEAERCKQAGMFYRPVETALCTVGEDTKQSSCQGDSGSVVFGSFGGGRFYALGVTSQHSMRTCNPGSPVTFSKVYTYMPWILENVPDLPNANEDYYDVVEYFEDDEDSLFG